MTIDVSDDRQGGAFAPRRLIPVKTRVAERLALEKGTAGRFSRSLGSDRLSHVVPPGGLGRCLPKIGRRLPLLLLESERVTRRIEQHHVAVATVYHEQKWSAG